MDVNWSATVGRDAALRRLDGAARRPYLCGPPSLTDYDGRKFELNVVAPILDRTVVAFGVAFETPVAVVLLVLTNLVTLQKLRSMRGYVLIIVFIIAAILTPPDVLSQTAMAVPMYLLYEGGLLFAAILARSSAAVEASEQGPA